MYWQISALITRQGNLRAPYFFVSYKTLFCINVLFCAIFLFYASCFPYNSQFFFDLQCICYNYILSKINRKFPLQVCGWHVAMYYYIIHLYIPLTWHDTIQVNKRTLKLARNMQMNKIVHCNMSTTDVQQKLILSCSWHDHFWSIVFVL